MNQELPFAGMRPAADPRAAGPVLQHVQAIGRLDGLAFELTVRQAYRNTAPDTLEVVYTFPLPLNAVLLGLSVELGGRRLAGVVTEKHAAQQRYEQAMADGDAPILLERCGAGLYSANLGNFKPGEEAVIEFRYAQLLAFEQDQVRLCVPTTVAPRYGDAVKGGGLQPHQAPPVLLTAQHGLALTLDCSGEWARAQIGCASHACSVQPGADGVRLTLGAHAWLDRDVVVTLRQPQHASMAQHAADGGRHVVLASLQPLAPPLPRESIDLKVLVDCSGSMAGSSIASAKLALTRVAQRLNHADRFSFSRFGSQVQHDVRRLVPARAGNLKMLEAMIAQTQADLGGTEMQGALQSVVALAGTGESADVLLITDGEVWDTQAMVALAAASKHRIFAVGVGAAPAESLLRQLAQASGGACEFATPGESLEAAVDRMFLRIRQSPWPALRMQWLSGEVPLEPDWVAGLPSWLYGGDTVHVFAGFGQAVPTQVRLVNAQAGASSTLVATAQLAAARGTADMLPRMAAATRLAQAPAEQALALALQYQLVTDQTHFLVIHERAEADKVQDMARLHQVPSMLAAGWGGTSAVAGMPAGDVRRRSSARAGPVPMAPSAAMRSPAPMRSPKGKTAPPAAHLLDAQQLLRPALAALASAPPAALDAVLGSLALPRPVADCIDALVAFGLERHAACAVLIRWLVERTGTQLSAAVEAALDALVDGVSVGQWKTALATLEQSLLVEA